MDRAPWKLNELMASLDGWYEITSSSMTWTTTGKHQSEIGKIKPCPDYVNCWDATTRVIRTELIKRGFAVQEEFMQQLRYIVAKEGCVKKEAIGLVDVILYSDAELLCVAFLRTVGAYPKDIYA